MSDENKAIALDGHEVVVITFTALEFRDEAQLIPSREINST